MKKPLCLLLCAALLCCACFACAAGDDPADLYNYKEGD